VTLAPRQFTMWIDEPASETAVATASAAVSKAML
jgi:hypothetical protein